MNKLANVLRRIFTKEKSMHLMAGGIAIVLFEMAVQPPEVFLYFLTPLALIGVFAGLILYFS